MLIEFSFGLIFWMTVSFLVVLFILGKFAWKPILGVLSERERTIDEALNEAKKARDECAVLKAQNEDLMRAAREERELMLKEARDIRDREISEAKAKAKAEGDAMLTRAGTCCFGDTVSIADACLVPQVYNAERVGLDVTSWPQIARVVAGLRQRPAFLAAHPDKVKPQ